MVKSGSLRGLEVTYGEHGWHVHIHEIILLEANPGKAIITLTHELKTRWQAIVALWWGCGL